MGRTVDGQRVGCVLTACRISVLAKEIGAECHCTEDRSCKHARNEKKISLNPVAHKCHASTDLQAIERLFSEQEREEKRDD